MVSQPPCLYFMVQFQDVKCHTHKIPFHRDIGVSSGQEAAEVHIFLDRSEYAFRLDGSIDPEQDPLVCGNLFLHCFTLLDEVFGNIQSFDTVFQ